MNAERQRLLESARREKHWKRWGPYLAERAWGTVREDYSPYGTAWEYFPHDDARSRVYRWTEDGIAGICDNHQRICFALALWNDRDPILKERLYGLTGNEGNHGEDVKEYYYYLDATPTHSYLKCLYKYPQAEYPYARLQAENRRRDRTQPELELIDTGIFDGNRYFDIFAEYAKADVDDICIRITCVNRGPEPATIHLLPTIWFRNTWAWGYSTPKPTLFRQDANTIDLGSHRLQFELQPELLFTGNESNTARLWNYQSQERYYKDAFHDRVIHGDREAINPDQSGTKACGWYRFELPPGRQQVVHLRLSAAGNAAPEGSIEDVFRVRMAEADEFYSFGRHLPEDARLVQRQAFAGLLWSKQFYHYVIESWLNGDPAEPPPPPQRWNGRNHAWVHLYNDDVISMPDKWEYPWYAAWDLAFHMIPFAVVDSDYAKSQLGLFLREWYMHPNGQLPAYEWEFSDVNPPVHAWACWRVYKIDAKQRGKADFEFLKSVFHKLLMNFTWWVNRKDSEGNNIFEGGFLGLDNVGVFDRSKPLPVGGFIEQADGTSWMAMYCLNMLRIAVELAAVDSSYEDIASKFFEHFLHIASAINRIGDGGLWDDADGFYYDKLKLPDGRMTPLRVRSVVGVIPLFAVDTLEQSFVDKLPNFRKRMNWFLEHRKDLCGNIASLTRRGVEQRRLLAVVQREHLLRICEKLFSEAEFLSPYGIRSLSQYHRDHPFVLDVDGAKHRVDYEPAESRTGLFGGNSNWRGPVWFPINYLLIESLQRFHHYFGDEVQVEFPSGSGVKRTLGQIAAELSRRLARIFLRDTNGRRPVFGGVEKFQSDPQFRDHLLFYEYFHGDNGAGIGASHQTGWTALVAKLLQQSGAGL